MSIPLDDLSFLLSDSSNVIVQIDANDPRSCPTEALVVVVNSQTTLSELEELPGRLRDECDWGLGYEVDLSKRSGGIGADGLAVVSLVLGVVGTVPTITSIFTKLGHRAPTMPDRESAVKTATWAVSMQYRGVPRNELRVVREERHQDHWTFWMTLDASGDSFEADVYGMPRSGAMATRVVWQNGDAWRRRPGEAGAERRAP